MISCKEEGEDDTSRVEARGKRVVRKEREGEKKTEGKWGRCISREKEEHKWRLRE